MEAKDLYNKAFGLKKRISHKEEILISKDSYYSLLYSKNICKSAFIEGENSIKKDPINAYIYCKEVIKQRWHEAEDTIKKNAFSAYAYSFEVMKERWPEAEKTIKRNPEWACLYSVNVLKERWPEAENIISKNQYAAHDYYLKIIKGNWKNWSLEEISKSTVWMYYFSKSLGDMLPKKLHKIMLCKKNEEFAIEYFEYIGGYYENA